MIRSRVVQFIFSVTIALLLFSSTSYADGFRLRLEEIVGGTIVNGQVVGGISTGIVVLDNNFVMGFGDWDPTIGKIVVNQAVGNFFINVTTGISKPNIPTNPNAYSEIDLSSVDVRLNSGSGILRITLEDTDFIAGPDGVPLQVTASVGGALGAPSGSAVYFQSWVDPTNAVPDLNPLGGPDQLVAGPLNPIGPTPGTSIALYSPGVSATSTGFPIGFGWSDTDSFVKAGSYSLFTQAIVSFTGGGSVSFNSNVAVMTPEPTSLLLLGSGLASLGLLSRKKKTTT
jgi:hypothetical protein